MATKRKLIFTIKQFNPDWAVHPGETLAELLFEANISQADLARSTHTSTKHINQIIKGKVPISPNMAIKLEEVLLVSAVFWINMQGAYDVDEARKSTLIND